MMILILMLHKHNSPKPLIVSHMAYLELNCLSMDLMQKLQASIMTIYVIVNKEQKLNIQAAPN